MFTNNLLASWSWKCRRLSTNCFFVLSSWTCHFYSFLMCDQLVGLDFVQPGFFFSILGWNDAIDGFLLATKLNDLRELTGDFQEECWLLRAARMWSITQRGSWDLGIWVILSCWRHRCEAGLLLVVAVPVVLAGLGLGEQFLVHQLRMLRCACAKCQAFCFWCGVCASAKLVSQCPSFKFWNFKDLQSYKTGSRW